MPKAGSHSTVNIDDSENLASDQNMYLIKTKFHIPSIRTDQLARAHLIDLINSGLDRALILVSAPAGYGKTTLASRWLKESGIASAWVSLDSGDNDPHRFLYYLLAALVPLKPGIENELFGLLRGIQPAQFENLINFLSNELNSVSNPFVLVLDDFHVIQSEVVLRIFTHLLEHLPSQMHIVILTRTDPPLPLSRLRVRNQLLDIRVDQLRFTSQEIAAFFHETMGLTLSDSDLSALEVRTEGWIASLQLAALSMQGSKDIHSFVSAFTGSHHYIMDYLVEEVLGQQSKEAGTFLLQTSILDRLSGPLCEAVVDMVSEGSVIGQEMLESFEEMNLFIIPLDEERRWYRYHHLFAEVLRKRLEQQYPQVICELHQRASQWYEKNGFISESIQQAIASSDQDRAAQLIEKNGCFILMSGELTTLLKWTDAIDFESETRPWLAIQKAWALSLVGDLTRIEPTLQAPEKLLLPLEPTDEVKTMQGTIAAARAHCANSHGNSQLAAEYARQALQLLPDCSAVSKSIRSLATSLLGDASWINGDLDDAIKAYSDAIKIGKDANNLNMIIIATSSIADILLEQGQLHRAEDRLLQALNMTVRPDGQRSPLAAKIYSSLARLSYEWNQLDDAEQKINQCIELSQVWLDVGQLAFAFSLKALLEQARNNLDKAKEYSQKAELMTGEQPLSPHWSIKVRGNLVRIWLAAGNLEKALQRVQKRGLKIDDEIPYQRENEYIFLLRVLLVQGDHRSAILLSERLLKQAEATGQVRLVIENLVFQALALQEAKETEQALSVLEKALSLAQPEGFVRIFLDMGEGLTRLLCQVQARQVGSSYASILLSKIGKISNMTQPSMELLIEPLTSREVEVLKLINTGCSNHEIASQLVISIPTVKRHISNIYGKLGVKSRTQALAIGKELKLFD